LHGRHAHGDLKKAKPLVAELANKPVGLLRDKGTKGVVFILGDPWRKATTGRIGLKVTLFSVST
jgi:hypothetical protein